MIIYLFSVEIEREREREREREKEGYNCWFQLRSILHVYFINYI